eukprot:m.211855 g.211855  ORF g.211855 m.211855 type:complete len:222 (+) comp10748_c0_seq6:926-1591(+)
MWVMKRQWFSHPAFQILTLSMSSWGWQCSQWAILSSGKREHSVLLLTLRDIAAAMTLERTAVLRSWKCSRNRACTRSRWSAVSMLAAKFPEIPLSSPCARCHSTLARSAFSALSQNTITSCAKLPMSEDHVFLETQFEQVFRAMKAQPWTLVRQHSFGENCHLAVRTMLLCAARKAWRLPTEVWHRIFGFLSREDFQPNGELLLRFKMPVGFSFVAAITSG